MTAGLDTSVAVRLLVGEPAAHLDQAHAVLGEGGVLVSDLVVGESYYVLRHHYGVPHGETIAALRTLLADPAVRCTGVAPQVLGEWVDPNAAPGLMDRLIHGDYAREGAVLVTFDRGIGRLPGARVIEG